MHLTINSNELAIAKLEVMVQEILQSNEQEEMQRDYDNNVGSGDGMLFSFTGWLLHSVQLNIIFSTLAHVTHRL